MADVQRRSMWHPLRLDAADPAGRAQARDWSLDTLAATLAIVVAVLARLAIEQIVGGVVPFVLTFPVVLLATLWRGARAGIITAVGCQLLTIRFVFPHWTGVHGGAPTDIANLLLSTLSLAGVIWAAARFRSVSAVLRRRCEREVETLSLVISEMDHRTKNNLQIAASLLTDQARTAGNDVAARELVGASNRLGAIASVYRNLTLAQDRSGSVRLDEYLADIVDHLRDSVVPARVTISIGGEAIRLASHKAMIVGLIVNEWIANALKYAFAEGGGSIRISLDRAGEEIVVAVADDGCGGTTGGRGGVGSRLMTALAATIDARIDAYREGGTTCTLRLDPRSTG